MKRGAELSLNVVIIAAICLLVLVVLTFIFSKSMGDWISGVQNCESKQGVCKASCADNEATILKTDCEKRADTLKKCCHAIDQT